MVRGKIAADGRITLPASIRRSMGLRIGDTIFLEVVGEEIVVRSAQAALRRVQGRLRSFAPKFGLASGELIAERRGSTWPSKQAEDGDR